MAYLPGTLHGDLQAPQDMGSRVLILSKHAPGMVGTELFLKLWLSGPQLYHL